MPKQTDDFMKLDRTRTEIASKCEELTAVEAAPIPIDEARAQIHEWIEREAEHFDGGTVASFGHDEFKGPFQLTHVAERHGNPALERGGLTRSASDDLGALLAALLPNELENLLVDRLERTRSAARLVLPAAKRTVRLAELRGEILELEVVEEKICRAIEDKGVEITRRPDARPEIVLALDLDRVEEAA